MAVTPKVLYEGTLTSTLTTDLYTTPASTTTIVTSIVATNTSGSSTNITVTLNGYKLWSATAILAGQTWTIGPNDLRQVLATTTKIKGGTSAGSDVDLRICGVEVS